MQEKKTYLTADGRRKLLEELEYLRTVRRAEVAAQIKFAKEGGDVSENAGYEEAKNAQAFLDGAGRRCSPGFFRRDCRSARTAPARRRCCACAVRGVGKGRYPWRGYARVWPAAAVRVR